MGPRMPHLTARKLLYAALVLILTLILAGGSSSAQPATPKPTIGYYPDWASGFVGNIEYDKLTHVNYFSLEPYANGNLNTAHITPSRLQQVVSDAHAAGVTVSICVGGWGRSDGFPAMASSPSARSNFVQNIVDYVAQYNLDGVDLDWEPVDTETEKDNYSTLVEELRAALSPGDLLSVAVNAERLEIRSWAVDDLDWIGVMAYDMNWPNADHSTYADAVSAMAFWEGLPAPRSKLVMGVPFYARDDGWNNSQPYHWIVDTYDPAPSDDWAGPYFFNGIDTVQAKTSYVYDNGYAGMMIWELSQDKQDHRSLLQAIYDKANEYGANPPQAPSELTATAVSSSQVDLSWTDNANNEDGFQVERSPNGVDSWTEIASLGVDSTTYTDSRLAAESTFYYRVYAHNAGGNSGTSNVASASTWPAGPRVIRFSGRTWTVKASDSPVGPGPNHFSDSVEDVWVDASDQLHLRISYRDGTWYSSEVITQDPLGYGAYTFTLASRVDQLDQNAVLGLFTWDDVAPEFNYREIDIEFARWGDPANDNSQYVVQPWDTPGNMYRFESLLPGDHSTHSFEWRADSVQFSSHQGHGTPLGDEIASWLYSGGDVPPEGSGNARINLWLYGGTPPSNGQGLEVIVESFQFAPLTPAVPPNAPSNLTATATSQSEIDLAWTDNSDNEDGFEIERSLDQASWSVIAAVGADATSYSDGGLQHSSRYYYQVRAFNAAGYSACSNVAEATTHSPPPYVDQTASGQIWVVGVVDGILEDTYANGDGAWQTITERESGGKPSNRYTHLEHKWTFEVQAGSAVTFFANAWAPASSDGDQFVLACSTNDVNYVDMLTITATYDDDSYLTFVLPPTTSGTVYVRVQDTDRTPGHREKDAVSIDHLFIRTELQPGDPPAAPTNLAATAMSASQIDLSWTDNADNELGFHVERSPNGSDWTQIDSVGADTTAYSDSGLQPSTTYHYRLRAYNGSGNSGYSNTASATTEQAGSIHVGDLDALASWAKASRWNADVTITVHGASHGSVIGARVIGVWSDGASGGGECTTDGTGTCTVSKSNIKSNTGSVTFTVTAVELDPYLYAAAHNHDPDLDSDGTRITVLQP